MAHVFGSSHDSEEANQSAGPSIVAEGNPHTGEMDFDSEEMEAEAFWFEVRQSVAGSPGYDADGYPLDDEGPMQRYPGEPRLTLAVDNSRRYPATWKKRVR